MKKNSNIRPTGRKGKEVIDRMKELMNITPIKESVDRSVVELTKIGPDGKAYGVVKENQEYFIKVSDKTENLVAEDFNYIGGLKNKKQEAYPSYAKATKKLNMKFIDLAENAEDKIFNILRSDNLMENDDDGSPVSVRYSSDRKGPSTSATDVEVGSVQTGNDGHQWITRADKNGVSHWKTLAESEDINGKEAPVDKKTSGDNVATGDNIGEDDFEKAKADGTKDGNTGDHAEKHVMEEVELTENEKHIDGMISGEEIKPVVKESNISISKAMNEMDTIIDEVSGGKEKVNEFMSNLSESEMNTLIDLVKKKV